MTAAGHSLIGELEDALRSGSKDKRLDTLRRVTDLFLAEADRLNEQQIDLFDDVLGHLIKRIEAKALAQLSRQLGPVANAPNEVVRRLARDDDIEVAEPVLKQSPRLTDIDLIDIANTKTQAHLLAISGRPKIGVAVTDVLLQRGDRKVMHKLAGNSGASFSESGFETLVKHSETDEQLAEKVGLRVDVPLRLFRELLLRATEAVRSRLLAMAGPATRDQIQRVLQAITEDAHHEAGFQNEHDFAEAYTRARTLKESGGLKEAIVYEFAKSGQYADVVATVSLLCGAPLKLVESLLQSEHREAVLVICKAAGLTWSTARLVLSCGGRSYSSQDSEAARNDYLRLSQANAQRVLRFWQVRYTTTGQAGGTPPAQAVPGLRRQTSAAAGR